MHGIKLGDVDARSRGDAKAPRIHRQDHDRRHRGAVQGQRRRRHSGARAPAARQQGAGDRRGRRREDPGGQARGAGLRLDARFGCDAVPHDGKYIVDSWNALEFDAVPDAPRRDRRRRHRPRTRQRVAAPGQRSDGARGAAEQFLPMVDQSHRQGGAAPFQEAGTRHQARRQGGARRGGGRRRST